MYVPHSCLELHAKSGVARRFCAFRAFRLRPDASPQDLQRKSRRPPLKNLLQLVTKGRLDWRRGVGKLGVASWRSLQNWFPFPEYLCNNSEKCQNMNHAQTCRGNIAFHFFPGLVHVFPPLLRVLVFVMPKEGQQALNWKASQLFCELDKSAGIGTSLAQRVANSQGTCCCW